MRAGCAIPENLACNSAWTICAALSIDVPCRLSSRVRDWTACKYSRYLSIAALSPSLP